MKRQKRNYTKNMIAKVAIESHNFSELCRKLGIKHIGGGSYELIKNRCAEYNIDTSHFTGKKQFGERNPNFNKRKTDDEILCDNKQYREAHRRLKRALISSGILYECAICGLDKWMEKTITLDIDHIDGNWKNCKIDNLRFICPNCHRQTITFGMKNKATKEIKEKFNYLTEKRIKWLINQRKVKNRPSLIELKGNVKKIGYRATGKLYNVSDNCIRKWILISEKYNKIL